MRPIIVFDVNETLLDLDSIRPIFDRIFGDPAAMRLWFADLITYSEALTMAGVYVPFTDIGGAVLQMLAATRGITISDADGAELTDRFATDAAASRGPGGAAPPPRPRFPAVHAHRQHAGDLRAAAGARRASSTCSSAGSASTRPCKRHKPAREAYHSVAAALGLDPGDICLIASHVWDTIGAGAAGWQAALILREGNAPLDVGPQPDYIGKDLDAIADQLIERYPPRRTPSIGTLTTPVAC